MKVAILGNQARAMVNFWSVLIRRLRSLGHEVLCIVPDADTDTEGRAALEAMGARVAGYPLDRKGLNPVRDAATFTALYRIFRQARPDVAFCFTIKPVIYGAMAAALARVPARYAMITGLGYMFEADTPVKRVLTRVAALLYRMALSCVRTVFFQNMEDRRVFEDNRIIPHGTSVAMCRGTGVALDHFAQAEPVLDPPSFLLVGRLLEAKGLREYAGAARLLKARYPDASFRVLGPPETGPGSVPLSEVEGWTREGIIEYLGETRDVRPYVAAASVMVLPSWREGTPCSVMEGMSMGRAAVVTDAPGCREVVEDGVNGFRVPLRDPEALAAAMERFIADRNLISRMGQAGRRLAETEFDADKVSEHILRVMRLV
ncbi:glycosyltransferase family 4 protein [Nitratidesulfovibrio sp. D1]|uniref:glycosyltransferase family 4 protein n=1 Tax=Nitratidesulfovibrio sp. D1 TaxID=3440151 RepID=UPI003EBA7995